MEIDHHCLKFCFPSTIAIIGPSNCGKSYLLSSILQNIADCFQEVPETIYYVYEHWETDYFESIQKSLPKKCNIVFIKGWEGGDTISELGLLNRTKDSAPCILCLDDQLEKISGKTSNLPLFTAITHHANLATIFISQALYLNDTLKQILRQSSFLVIFDNVRNRRQLRDLSLQMSNSSKFLSFCMQDNLSNHATNYILLDVRSRIPPDVEYNVFEKVRVRNGIYGVCSNVFAYYIDDKK